MCQPNSRRGSELTCAVMVTSNDTITCARYRHRWPPPYAPRISRSPPSRPRLSSVRGHDRRAALLVHYPPHAAHPGREFRVFDVQFDIGGKLPGATVRAPIVGTG